MVMSFVHFGDGYFKATTKMTEGLTSTGATWRRQGSADISRIEGGFILTEERYFFNSDILFKGATTPGKWEFSITARFFQYFSIYD